MITPSVSVIINTYNRAQHLKRLLDALSRQTYCNFEVLVINGPSTDETEEILRQYYPAIRTDKCPIVNLSVSRNIGIKNASGEIIAFIDDDAVPQDIRWIENAVKYFDDEKVGIVGGTVYQLGGGLMFRYGWFDIYGNNIAVEDTPQIYDDPNAERFSCGQGCNVFFRKKAIIETGGFDEYFAFYLDESDLGMRIIQHGYTCRYGEDMGVIHEAAPGPFRKSKYHENLFIIGKSQGYFVMKATEDTHKTIEQRKSIARKSVEGIEKDIKQLLKENIITHEEYEEFLINLKEGIEQGIKDSERNSRILCSFKKQKSIALKKYEKALFLSHLNLCLFANPDSISDRGNNYTNIDPSIKGLTEQGHNVFIMIPGEKTEISLSENVNICTVCTEKIKSHNNESLLHKNWYTNSYEVYRVLQELKDAFGVSWIITPNQIDLIVSDFCFGANRLYTTEYAETKDDLIILNRTGIQYGPYIELQKGKYEIEYTGYNLHLINDYRVTSDKGEKLIPHEIIERSKNKAKLSFILNEQMNNVEFVAINQSELPVLIEKIALKRINKTNSIE